MCYGPGLVDEPVSVVGAPDGFLRLLSDGRRAFVLSGADGAWQVDEMIGR